MEYSIEGHRVSLHFDKSQLLIDKCKFIGMHWSPKKRTWWVEDTIGSRRAINRIFNLNIPITNKSPALHSNKYSFPAILMDHQKSAIEIAKLHNRWAFYHDMGTGKTLTAIEIIKMHNVKTLIVCPLALIRLAWMEDIRSFEPSLRTYNLWKKGEGLSCDNSDIIIVNFESFKKYYGYLTTLNIQMLVVDESSKIKNIKSKITKQIISFADTTRYLYLLSGNPAPNSELEYFPQIRALDVLIFGNSFYRWRETNFYPDYNGFKWTIGEDQRKVVMQQIASVSSVVRKEDVLDLPSRVNEYTTFQLDAKETKAYKDMVNDLSTIVYDTEITATQKLSNIMKLRQILSGFVLPKDGPAMVIGRETKLRALVDLLDSIGNKQVLIWTQFQYEAQSIVSALKGAVKCDGTISHNQQYDNVKSFMDGKSKYLIAHPLTIGHGTTLVNCSDVVYYSLSYSYEQHSQSRDRTHRKGQKNKCTYFYMLGYMKDKKTIDSPILKALQTKQSISEQALQYIKNYK